MSTNPLQHYFRRPSCWIKLPTLGKWYTNSEVSFNENHEVQIYGITAIDEIMLNTPDALLNGYALESVIQSCVPEVHNVKKLLQPDLEALFVGIKSASNNGKHEINRICPNCKHENTFELNCNVILDTMKIVEDSDTVVNIENDIKVYIKPYDFEMRSLFIKRQLEEQKIISDIEKEKNSENSLELATKYAKTIENMSKTTFKLMADSVTAVEITGKTPTVVSNKEHITEWLINANKNITNFIVSAVTSLNNLGPIKTTDAHCENCNHSWKESLNFDPVLFFLRR